MRSDRDFSDAARAILDGTPIDWDGLTQSAGDGEQSLVAQLKLLSTVADVHRAQPEPAQPELGSWGHLTLLEKVGTGSFGEVFRAWDTRLDREVALKLLPASAAGDSRSTPIIQEGRLLARVTHPNVATIYGAELIAGRVGLWMEFVHGCTLEELLRSGHQFSLTEVLSIGRELCQAVSAVHAAGLLHGDVKTQNVMRTQEGRVVLLDFGTGHEHAEAVVSPMGTPRFIAPEVLAGGPATVRSDVYGVGVVLYRLLTGAFPVRAETLDELRRAHERDERVSLADARPELPPEIAVVMARATENDPERRYESVEALAADLLSLASPSRARWPWRWPQTAIVAACLVAAVWLGSRRNESGAGGPGVLRAGVGAQRVAQSDRPVIVVLPFRNLRSDADSDLWVDGLTYKLIRSLAVVDGLIVRSAASSFALKGKDLSLAEIGLQREATMVLEGSVSGAGDQLRVQAQLSAVGRDTPLWVDKFDRRMTDVLTVQDDVARGVVNQLRLALGKGQRRYDLDVTAQALYLQARALTERRTTQDAQAAVKLYEQVIARDPAFAPAYAGMCDAYGFMSQSLPDVLGLPHQQALALMRAAATKSIELDPLLAEAHAAMGVLYSRDNAWDEADRSFRRAISLNPSLLHIYTSYAFTTLMPLGRFADAEVLLKEGLRRDPLSMEVRRELAVQYVASGRAAEAIPILLEMNQADGTQQVVKLLLARAQSLAGRIDDAMPFWESVSSEVGYQHWMAYAYVRGGRRAEIERLAAQPQHPYRATLFFAALGDTDRALDALHRAAEEAPQRTVRLLQYPELASLRNDPRFQAVRAMFHLR